MNPSIFKAYYNIAFNDETGKIDSKFLANNDLIDKGYFYYQDRDEYVNFEMEMEDPVNPIFSTSIITRNKFIEIKLEDYKKNILSELEEIKSKNSLEEFKLYLRLMFDDMDKYYKKIKTASEIKFKEVVTSHIESFINDLKILFDDVSGHHRIYNHILKVNQTNSYFGCKDLKMSFFKDLYISTYELNLIDDSIIDEETFINVFTTPKSIPESPIIFMAGNALVAHYLESLEIFFNNFNPKTIEKSKMFLNKQKTPITSSILYTSKSRASENVKSQYPNIDYQIELLKDEFLK